MAKALFITTNDLVKHTIINGNVDPDSYTQYIFQAQQVHIQNYLGTKLYNKINNKFYIGSTNDTLERRKGKYNGKAQNQDDNSKSKLSQEILLLLEQWLTIPNTNIIRFFKNICYFRVRYFIMYCNIV